MGLTAALGLMSSCSAASRREAPPSTRAITRMRMSAEYAFGIVRPPDESMPPDSPIYRSLGNLRFYSARTCSSWRLGGGIMTAAFDTTAALLQEQDCELRPYQADAIAKVEEAIEQGIRRIMLMAATGSGKTLIASSIVQSAQPK